MRLRKQIITNLYVNSKDITKLANGYVIYKRANGHAHSIIPKAKVVNDRIKTKQQDIRNKIAKLNDRLAKLTPTTTTIADITTTVSVPKKPYVKKNMEYWNRKAEHMRLHSPLIKFNAGRV